MNKFFIRIVSSFLLITQLHAAQIPSLRDLCLKAGAKVSDEVLLQNLDRIPSDCLQPILIEKIAAKLFPLMVKPIESLSIATEPVLSIAITPNANYALFGSGKELKLWDIAEKREISSWSDQKDFIKSVAITPDAKAALSSASALILWNLTTKKGITLKQKTDINSVAISADGSKALHSYSLHNSIIFLDLSNKKETSLPGHNRPVKSVVMTPNATKGLSGAIGGTVILWDLANLTKIHRFSGHADTVFSVAITPDGLFGLSGSADNTLKLWDLTDKKLIGTLTGHGGPVLSVAITSNGKIAFSGSLDDTVKIWDLSKKKEIATFARLGRVDAVALSADGTIGFSGLRNMMKVFDLRPFILEQFPMDFLKEAYVSLYRDNKSKEEVYAEIAGNFIAQDFVEYEIEALKRRRKW